MLVVLVVILFSGQAVVIERAGLTESDCRAIGERLVEDGSAATFACFERFDA